MQHVPPARHVVCNLVAPRVVLLCTQMRYQRAQCRLAVADESNLHRIAQVQHAWIDIDLHTARLAFFRQEFGIRKAGPDHQQGVAVIHQVPTRFGAEQSDRTGHERQIVRHGSLAEQCFRHTGTEQVRDFDDFIGRVQRAGADQHRDLATGIEYIGRERQIGIARHHWLPGVADAAVYRAVFAWRRFHGIEFLHIIRNDDAGHRTLVACDAHGAIDQMSDLRRRRRHVHEFMCDILEQRNQVDFLLVIAADCRTLLLADDGDYRLVVHLGVVQAIQQMNGTRPRGRQAYADFTGKFGMRASHECSQFFVTCLHELEHAVGTAECSHDAVDAVARVTVNALNAPLGKSLQQEIAHCRCHVCILPSIRMNSRSLQVICQP